MVEKKPKGILYGLPVMILNDDSDFDEMQQIHQWRLKNDSYYTLLPWHVLLSKLAI